ncbi:MAG: helix-turn-helix domain-containing protein [bacterium]|nr:helix-turn-helix domain-containing protein [bacterium]
MNTFNHKITLLRDISGFSMNELAEKIGVSRQAIFKYENGDMKPDSTILIKLANALGVSTDYFFQNNSSGPTIKLASIAHREKNKVEEQEFEKIKRETIDFILRLIDLEQIANARQEFSNPLSEISIKSNNDIEKATKVLRKKWSLGTMPIANVVQLLESKGIKIFEVEKSNKFEGFAAWVGRIPIIVINSSIQEVTRVRFTTLHELGHILLDFCESLDEISIERLCDAFSSELLFPKELVVIELGDTRTKISVEELIYVKKKYGFSIQAIIFSALNANVISKTTYFSWKKLYDQWYKEGRDFGKYEANECPQRFNMLLYNCISEDKISIGKASILSKQDESELKKKYQLFDNHITD